jgi:hypothetical protein
MKVWLILCAVLMLLGIVTAVASFASGWKDPKLERGMSGFAAGAIMLAVGFFGGVIVILAYTL